MTYSAALDARRARPERDRVVANVVTISDIADR